MTDELEMALAWLHGTADHYQWGTRPPGARSLYDHRCDAPPNHQCLLGGVYVTPAGLLFYGRTKGRMLERIEVDGRPANTDVPVVHAALLTMPPDFTTPRADEWLPLSCQHGLANGEAMTTGELRRRALDRLRRAGTAAPGTPGEGTLLPY